MRKKALWPYGLLVTTFFCNLTSQLSASTFLLHSIPVEAVQPIDKEKRDFGLLEVKGGYFFFSEHKLREIYNKGGEDIQLSFSYAFLRKLQLYGSVEYLERHGRSLNSHQRTRIREIPISLGLKAVFPIHSKIDYYFTLGPRYFFVHIKNKSSL